MASPTLASLLPVLVLQCCKMLRLSSYSFCPNNPSSHYLPFSCHNDMSTAMHQSTFAVSFVMQSKYPPGLRKAQEEHEEEESLSIVLLLPSSRGRKSRRRSRARSRERPRHEGRRAHPTGEVLVDIAAAIQGQGTRTSEGRRGGGQAGELTLTRQRGGRGDAPEVSPPHEGSLRRGKDKGVTPRTGRRDGTRRRARYMAGG